MPDELTPEEQEIMSQMEAGEPVEVEEEFVEEAADDIAPDPEVTPEVKPEPEVKPDAKPPEGFVPHAAMHTEREMRRAAEARERDLRAQIEQLQAANKPQEAADEMPDPIIDPAGFKEWQNNRWQTQEAQRREYEQQQLQQVQQQRIMQAVQSDEARFTETNPDYNDAVTHLRNERAADLQAMGASQEQIGQILHQETMGLIQSALQAGQSPAQVAYNLAQRRGYAKKADTATAAAQMEAKARASAQTSTLSAASGGGGVTKYTPEQLANMSEAEYTALKKKNPDMLKNVLGG